MHCFDETDPEAQGENIFLIRNSPPLPQNPLNLSQFCDSSFISLPIDLTL